MATVTPNFNWPVPTSTDLVKDGAVAIEALGDSIDASLVDLKGGTTGQVLSKASNTDMDFTWVTNADGDITGVTAGTGLTGGGTSGTVSVAFDIANYGGGQFAAGKNKIINGDFGIWQRGTSFTPTSGSFSADRFYNVFDGTGSTRNISRQTFTPGTAPVAGYESSYFLRYAQTVAGTGGNYSTVSQNIEDVRTFAGQTVTFSFYAKAASNITLPAVYAVQRFGSGGSTEVATSIGSSVAITTSWQRFTFSFTVPSISGKTIGTSSYLDMEFYTPLNSTFTLDTWGWQLEAGSTATPFQTATGNPASELVACQRYYQKTNNQSEAPGTAPSSTPINCLNASTTLVVGVPPFKVSMRVAPTVTLYSPVTGTTGKIRSGGADITASVGDVGEFTLGYISATGLTAGSNSSIAFTASAEL